MRQAAVIPNLRQIYRRKIDRANKLQDEGKLAEALKVWEWYLTKDPQDPDVLFNCGIITTQLNQNDAGRYKAAEYFERVVLSPVATPMKRSDAMNTLGIFMDKLNNPEMALKTYAVALNLCPENTAARNNYASSLRFANLIHDADREYKKVIELDPQSVDAHLNSAFIALSIGDYERGFREFQWRWKSKSFPTPPFRSESNKPEWKGEDLNGKTLLITEEQGFGDSIMFIRYVREIKDHWPQSSVKYFGSEALMNLFREGVPELDECFPRADEEDFDFHISTMTIPVWLGTKLETVPSRFPYITAKSGDRMPGIGIIWAGSPKHGKDAFRSLAPEQFQPIIDARPDVAWYSLQRGPKEHEVDRLTGVTDLSRQINNFTDTAAILNRIDLLISVDTACVHLAGALDRPVWMLCPHAADWRWGLTGETSAWYRSLRILRQPERYDWATPIQQVIERLKTWNTSSI